MRRRLDARTQTSRANRRHRRFLTALKAWDRNKDCHPLRVTWAPKVAHRLESVGQGTGLSRRADHAKGTEGFSPPSKRETICSATSFTAQHVSSAKGFSPPSKRETRRSCESARCTGCPAEGCSPPTSARPIRCLFCARIDNGTEGCSPPSKCGTTSARRATASRARSTEGCSPP